MEKGYNIKLAEEIKKNVSIPVFVAGKMNDPDLCEAAIRDGKIDGVALGRGRSRRECVSADADAGAVLIRFTRVSRAAIVCRRHFQRFPPHVP